MVGLDGVVVLVVGRYVFWIEFFFWFRENEENCSLVCVEVMLDSVYLKFVVSVMCE